MTPFHQQTAHELLAQIRAGQIDSAAVTADVLSQIDRVESRVKAYARVHRSPIQSAGGPVPLPIAIKDNICIRGQETTCASKILQGFRPPYHAAVMEKILAAGGQVIGQANMDEFAFGSSTENSGYGPTGNPWDLQRVPGGSSGGSAAAVAAGEAVWALGSDTGGSIRQPASFCGVVGVKPTYGRVSRYGLIAFASSLDQIGPITKDVTDAALLLNLIAGHDPRDSTSADVPVPDYTQALVQDVRGLRLGVPREFFVDGLDPEVRAAMDAALKVFRDQGAEVVEISLPHTEYCVAVYYIIATAEASSNLARYDGVRFGLRAHPDQPRKNPLVDMFEATREKGFGTEAKRRIMLGTYALSSGYYDAYYLRGQKVRTLIKRDFDQAFASVDAVITPTSPTTAFKIGERTDDPLAMYLSDICTISANLAGIPAMSLPCGFSAGGLPIGLQIMTRPFAEEMMFRVGYTYEQQAGWHQRRCPLAA